MAQTISTKPISTKTTPEKTAAAKVRAEAKGSSKSSSAAKGSSAAKSSAVEEVCSAPTPRFRSFLPDGRGGWREASGPEDMRQINLRLIRAALGMPLPFATRRAFAAPGGQADLETVGASDGTAAEEATHAQS